MDNVLPYFRTPKKMQAPWYALHVRPHCEEKISQLLAQKGYENYVPHYRSTTSRGQRTCSRAKSVFPGYLFCRFFYEPTADVLTNGASIVTTPGVLRILGGRPPKPVPDSEIEDLRHVIESGLLPAECSYPTVGQHCAISRGPLKGTNGVVLRCGQSWQFVVSVNILRRAVAVTVPGEWIGAD